MSKHNQKPPKPQQEPPAEEVVGYAAEDIPEGGEGRIVGTPEEVTRPMAVQPPTIEDRLKALELANPDLEKRIAQLERNCKASHGMR